MSPYFNCGSILLMIFLIISFGLVFGSFINAWVWRLHEQIDKNGNPKKLTKKRKAELSISKGRSMCPDCGHALAAKDLVPVFSWLYLRGRCRYCYAPISPQYPIVELVTALLFVVSYLSWPIDLVHPWQIVQFATWLFALVGLVALAVFDIKWMLIPDKIVLPLTVAVLVSTTVQIILGRPLQSIVEICGAVAITSGLFWILFQVSRGKWIGGGDVKLGLLTGLLIGTAAGGFLYLMVASLLGIIFALPSMISGKASVVSKIAFGPSLIAACVVVVLYGQAAIDWYTNLIGL